MTSRMLKYIGLLLLISVSTYGWAKQVPPKPRRLVNDYAGVLSPSQEQILERDLERYNDSTSTQIAIVLDRSLEGDDPFDYSYRIAEAWGIGRRGKDNGVLIYVAIQDHKIFIQTGSNVEGALPDAIVKRIIENTLVPAFRRGKYYQGLSRATKIIRQLLSGEFMPTDQTGAPPVDFVVLLVVLLMIIILITIIIRYCQKTGKCGEGDGGGYYRGGTYRTGHGGGWIIGGGFGGGHSSGGGFGGGGFGGFGGGGFSGGGAGGSW